MELVVFEDAGYRDLLPLVYSRAVFDLRCGFDSLLEKLESAMGRVADALVVRELIAAVLSERQQRSVNPKPSGRDQLWVNGRLLVRRKLELPDNSAAWDGETLLAARVDGGTAAALPAALLQQPNRLKSTLSRCQAVTIPTEAATLINYPWQLVQGNGAEITRQSGCAQPDVLGQVDHGAHLVNKPAIHIGAGSRIMSGAVLVAEDGPIHIDDNVRISPNATILGPCHIAAGCVVQPGALIRDGCSIGPVCKVGGELEGTIIHGYSNKQHAGFLGHSYIGQWVNLGADTVNSDLKNTYGAVSVAINGRTVNTGLTFVGAFIGDHSKTAIQTALPTGCVIGFSSNVFVSRHVPTFVPSFSWLTDDRMETNDPDRALAVARKVAARREQALSKAEESLFLSIAEEACRYEAAQ